MQLKASGSSQILADVQIPAGTYSQVRLHVVSVMVTKAGATTTAKLPSSELKLVGKLVVKADATASFNLDFMLDKSLHLTGSGMFILTPVIKLDSQSDAQVQINDTDKVKVESGTEEDSSTLGSNENGELKTDFQLNDNLKLDVTGTSTIHVIDPGQSESSVKVSAQKAVSIALQSGQIDLSISVKLEVQNGKKVWHVVGQKALNLVDVFVDAQTGAVVSM